MKQGIIFDMDGTLWDSADGVAKSWTQVIQNEYKKDMAVTEQDIKRVMGKTMDVIGDIFFPELTSAEQKSLVGKCGDWENEYLRRNGGKLYPELENTLKKLKEQYHLYIVSTARVAISRHFWTIIILDSILKILNVMEITRRARGITSVL
mgnify:CR=1 FL=1